MKKRKIFLVAFIFLVSYVAQISAQKNQVPFPIIPLLIEYEFAPLYFSQEITDHPQYTYIEAIVNQSVYQIILSERESKRRVYYSNSEARTKALLREGKEAYVAAIDFKEQEGSVDRPPIYGFGFRDKNGQAIIWRFLPASRPSERGAGLTPLSSVPGLRLEYRILGSAAGEGTAIQIGDRVIEAQPWTQISSPPYFLAYHGSITEGRDIGVLHLGEENWRVISSPKELSEGAKWTLVNEKGRERNFQITNKKGDEFVISEIDVPAFQTSKAFLNVRNTEQGFALQSIMIVNDKKKMMRITFTSELNLFADKSETAFYIDQGTQSKMVQGIIQTEKQTNGVLLNLQIKSPDWAKSKIIKSLLEIKTDGYKIKVS